MASGALVALLALAVAGAGCSGGGQEPVAPPTGVTSSPAATSSTSSSSTSTSSTSSSFAEPVLLGHIGDEEVTESSGLVASRSHPGRYWTHNDSDQAPVLYCLEADGGPCGRWSLVGAANRDWEALAAGPGPEPGRSYLYVGDIGDNAREREQVVVYRAPEPQDATTGGGTLSAQALPLSYEDGPRDAEALMVHPTTGDIYVVTKSPLDTGVYRAAPGDTVLRRVATLALGLLGVVTGGDVSPDGRRVALCTPGPGYELTLAGPQAGFDSVWSAEPVAVPLPPRAQGEAVAYRLDGDALVTTSEGPASPLHEVPRK